MVMSSAERKGAERGGPDGPGRESKAHSEAADSLTPRRVRMHQAFIMIDILGHSFELATMYHQIVISGFTHYVNVRIG